MSITIRRFDPATLLALLFLMIMIMATVTPINGLNPRKLDESTVPAGTPDSKCTSCCNNNNPCNQSPPPPPPSPPPPSPPPSPKKPPSSKNCPPPPPSPPSGYIYMTGPPGNLYPVDPYFSGARRSSTAVGLPLLFGCGLMGLLMGFW